MNLQQGKAVPNSADCFIVTKGINVAALVCKSIMLASGREKTTTSGVFFSIIMIETLVN